MRTVILVCIMIHGIIHLLGFIKAFQVRGLDRFASSLSKKWGILWLIACLFFMATGAAYWLDVDFWWVVGLTAVLLSQVLILFSWSDARWGTLLNLLIVLISMIGFQSWNFERQYREEVRASLLQNQNVKPDTLSAEDLSHLPEPVRQYLYYSGVVNKPKVASMKAVFSAEMRGKGLDWFRLTAEQYNFFDTPKRLFFLKAKVKGLPVLGYHVYKENKARMIVKMLSLLPVVDERGNQLVEAETVTFFNDMCFLAPATLIDRRIQWEQLDSLSVRAQFTNWGRTISAKLYFNNEGQLVNFVSDDRYDMNQKKKFRFSTPLSDYREINGYRLANYGEARWHYPEGVFVYGKYRLQNIRYNIDKMNQGMEGDALSLAIDFQQ